MSNFADHGIIGANVKYYDQYNRPFTRHFSTLDTARTFYVSLCKGNECPIYARLCAFTIDGPIVLREYRPS